MPKSLLSSESMSWDGRTQRRNLVQRFAQAVAVAGRSTGASLARRDPDVVKAGAFQLPAHGRPDLAAALDVLDPELAHGLVRMAEGEAVGGLGVGEARGVEVELSFSSWAQVIQPWKWSGSISERSTRRPPNSP